MHVQGLSIATYLFQGNQVFFGAHKQCLITLRRWFPSLHHDPHHFSLPTSYNLDNVRVGFLSLLLLWNNICDLLSTQLWKKRCAGISSYRRVVTSTWMSWAWATYFPVYFSTSRKIYEAINEERTISSLLAVWYSNCNLASVLYLSYVLMYATRW